MSRLNFKALKVRPPLAYFLFRLRLFDHRLTTVRPSR